MKSLYKTKFILFVIFLINILIVTNYNVYSGVRPGIGSFFVNHKDYQFNVGYENIIERYYDSKSTIKGIFGYGWECNFTKYALVLPEGNIIFSEFEIYFTYIFYENYSPKYNIILWKI